MAPFRWPSIQNDLALAKEVASRKPQTHQEWDELATVLSEVFSSDSNRVELKGRGCRERLARLIEKNEQDDKKSLKKSGTEEEYSELSQLLQDISTYRRDMEENKAKTAKEKEQKKKKEREDKKMGEEIRKKAMEGLASSKRGKVTRKRATRLSAVQMLEQKNERRADLKERELKLKAEELQLQNKKFEQEAAERNERLKLELEERRMFLQILKEKM
ncbi:plasminogen-binding protein PgbA-like isoform X2 [Montipora capricornis]|uniref:plasminogen-binding protein PgbA-like isoform X2 n=1 Tax=Montipora capricornis TaxID=246305 RepID=UPI0035F12169